MDGYGATGLRSLQFLHDESIMTGMHRRIGIG